MPVDYSSLGGLGGLIPSGGEPSGGLSYAAQGGLPVQYHPEGGGGTWTPQDKPKAGGADKGGGKVSSPDAPCCGTYQVVLKVSWKHIAPEIQARAWGPVGCPNPTDMAVELRSLQPRPIVEAGPKALVYRFQPQITTVGKHTVTLRALVGNKFLGFEPAYVGEATSSDKSQPTLFMSHTGDAVHVDFSIDYCNHHVVIVLHAEFKRAIEGEPPPPKPKPPGPRPRKMYVELLQEGAAGPGYGGLPGASAIGQGADFPPTGSDDESQLEGGALLPAGWDCLERPAPWTQLDLCVAGESIDAAAAIRNSRVRGDTVVPPRFSR